MSTLMFWNKQNNNNQNNSSNNETKNGGKRNWLHAPDALLNGHVVYLVKFLGTTPVEQPKGIEVVKDAIRRLQFAQQMKKVDTGNQSKLKKVEITVSVDGVAVQEPRTQKILHQFPLHNISYCADEKGVKKFFSFIAKNGTQQPDQQQQNNNNNNDIKINGHLNGNSTNNNQNEEHECFVFVSSKLASDITLTIGQAFDLAYKRYMNENGKTTELSKIQHQNKQLENTVMLYKNRLKELSEIISKNELDKMLNRLGIRDLFEIPQLLQNSAIDEINGNKKSISESSNDDKLLIETGNNGTSFVPIIPPRQNLQNQINNTLDAFKPSGQKMSELLLNSDSDSDFDPRADEIENNNKISNDLFGFEPPKTFGQQLFTNNNNNNNNINNNYNNNNNINNRTISPPPLLAPPPKAAVPRRNTGLNNGGSQDLFGSTPFNPNTPSIFDGKFNENDEKYQAPTANGVVSSISYNDISSTSINTSPQQYQTPSLQLNSTPFGDPTSDPFVTNFNMNKHHQQQQNKINNPFNESGFYDMSAVADSSSSSPSINKINAANVLSDLNTLSNNSDTLDSILHSSLLEDNKNHDLNGTGVSGGFKSMNQQHQQTNNNFSGISTGIFNPFTNKLDTSLLNPRNNISNYDALRNSPDLDSMQLTPASNNTASSSPIFIKNNNNNNNNSSNYGGSSGDKSPANNNSYDIFKDAASKAFSEFNPDNSSLTKIAYEFSNKMAGANFGYQQKSNFSVGNNNKQSLVDDFSLESLDPLRK